MYADHRQTDRQTDRRLFVASMMYDPSYRQLLWLSNNTDSSSNIDRNSYHNNNANNNQGYDMNDQSSNSNKNNKNKNGIRRASTTITYRERAIA